MPKNKKIEQDEIQITIHLPIDKTLDSYLMQLAKTQERSKLAQIRWILSDYMKNHPIK